MVRSGIRVAEFELDRIATLVDAYCNSALARRLAGLPMRGPSGRSRSGTRASSSTAGSTSSGARAERALVVDYKSNALLGARPRGRSSLTITAFSSSCTRSRASATGLGPEWRSSTSSSSGRSSSSSPQSSRRRDVGALEAELSGGYRAESGEGDFKPTPSEFACSGCPALNLVCAGPDAWSLSGVSLSHVRVAALKQTSTGNLPALEAVLVEVEREGVDAVVVARRRAQRAVGRRVCDTSGRAGAQIVHGNADREGSIAASDSGPGDRAPIGSASPGWRPRPGGRRRSSSRSTVSESARLSRDAQLG